MQRPRLTPRSIVQWAGLAGGPALAAVCFLLLPEQYRDAATDRMIEFSRAGRVTLAVMTWMAVWWLTEAIDISATALLPIPLLPLLGAASVAEATAPYAHPLIFLFLGGFLVALSMQRWGLDRRIALNVLRLVGDRPTNLIAGLMLATAFLSMFVSNTATTAMMLPIALSVIALLGRRTGGSDDTGTSTFGLCMMLAIAYAASIGGIGTKIGTPPNGFLLGFVEDQYGHEIDFATWLTVAMPLLVVFLPVTWLLLTRVIYPVTSARIEGARDLVREAYHELGNVKPGEWVTLLVFAGTALAWITRPILARWIPGLSNNGDTVIVMVAAVLLFLIPVSARRREFAMNWQTAQLAPWGILILFGGGLSLAAAVRHNGVSELIGNQVSVLGDVPPVVLVLAVTALVIFLTELTSNTATTATLVPILAALAPGLGVHPYLLIFPAAIAASCAFMMPVATPPNAIVFGSGYLTIPQMCKAGLWLNLIGIALITALAYWVIMPLLGVNTSATPG
jgi:sodium-dependent dicarboxylate transporter 2/3/5